MFHYENVLFICNWNLFIFPGIMMEYFDSLIEISVNFAEILLPLYFQTSLNLSLKSLNACPKWHTRRSNTEFSFKLE